MSTTAADFAAAVWTAPGRTLATGTAGAPATPAEVFAAAVWSYATRTVKPADLLEAIRRRFEDAGLAGRFPGGIFLAAAGRAAGFPYAVVEEVSAALAWKSSTSKARRTRLRFKAYDDDGASAAALGDALEDAFSGRALAFTGGDTGPFLPGDRGHRIDPALSRAGAEVWFAFVEFSVMVRRGA